MISSRIFIEQPFLNSTPRSSRSACIPYLLRGRRGVVGILRLGSEGPGKMSGIPLLASGMRDNDAFSLFPEPILYEYHCHSLKERLLYED